MLGNAAGGVINVYIFFLSFIDSLWYRCGVIFYFVF